MSKTWLWKILLGVAFLIVPGSLLLLPVVVAVLQRQRASRQVELVQTAPSEPHPQLAHG